MEQPPQEQKKSGYLGRGNVCWHKCGCVVLCTQISQLEGDILAARVRASHTRTWRGASSGKHTGLHCGEMRGFTRFTVITIAITVNDWLQWGEGHAMVTENMGGGLQQHYGGLQEDWI